jgi:O-antigen/teichoic acid export membrane protein
MASTIANIAYNSVAKVLTMGVALVTSTILARKLGAEDYGVVGIAMAVIGFLGRFNDLGMTAAVVQRPNVEARLIQTAQALNFLIAAGLFLCALAFAPLTVTIFKSREVPKVVCALAFTLILSAIGFLPAALLTRELQFVKLRMPFVTGSLVRGVVSVACALTGWKYWSLVFGSLAGTLATSILLRLVRPVKAGFAIDRSIGRELLHFGLPILMSSLLAFLVLNIDNFVIGSFLGATQLGYYTIAFTWATYGCTTLSETVHSVLFPRFSQSQANREELAAMYCRSLRAVMFVAVMANAALFAIADGFLVTVLGKGNPRWLPALGTLQILCVYGAIRASIEPIGNVILALGRSKLLLRAVALPISIELCLLPFVSVTWGLRAVACLVGGAYAVQWVVYGPFLERELGLGVRRLAKVALPVFVAAFAGILAERSIGLPNPLSWLSLIVRSGTVCLAFIITHELLTRGAMVSELKPLVLSRVRRVWSTPKACSIRPAASAADTP